MSIGGYIARNRELFPAIEAQQREADGQASRWIEREVIGLIRGRQAFGGNQPRLTYTRKGKLATMSHGAA